jgi:hypothetical protein
VRARGRGLSFRPEAKADNLAKDFPQDLWFEVLDHWNGNVAMLPHVASLDGAVLSAHVGPSVRPHLFHQSSLVTLSPVETRLPYPPVR